MKRRRPARHLGANGAAFVRLYHDALPDIRQKLALVGLDGADAEDIAQRAFEIYLLQSTEPEKPIAWLIETAWRLASNLRRLARYRFETVTEPKRFADIDTDPRPLPDETAALGEWCDMAETLPPRALESLRFLLLGYTCAEVARILKVSRPSAWIRLKHARRTLAERVDDMEKNRADETKPESTIHYFKDERVLVEVTFIEGGEKLVYAFLQERPDMSFVGVFQDTATNEQGFTQRVKVKASRIAKHESKQSRARSIAGRALARGPLRALLAELTTCLYNGAECWRCGADNHELRKVVIVPREHDATEEGGET